MKRTLRIAVLASVAAALAACSSENRYEHQADQITRAVMNNDLRPVQNDIASGVAITRVKVAQWSDELNAQGKLLSIKETQTGCAPGWHCFAVTFQKHTYVERMLLDDRGKVVDWQFHMAPASTATQ